MQKWLSPSKTRFSLQCIHQIDCLVQKNLLGGGFKHFLFSALFGEDSQFDVHIFQMGWFNHQPDPPYLKKKKGPNPTF